ncbi:MAG TPA: MotA/TolQ/ExbB proton channel family protein [Candidatus Acidoferrales bacterium]|nr:MotA/TolQ/ExbB proton channel family protein [Candidatus Acidoferrales bacterium]
MIDFFVKGGVFMYPILLCSITAVAIFIERTWSLRRSQVIPKDFIDEVDGLIRKGKIPEAVMRCQNNRSSIARIVSVALKNIGKRREIIKEYLEEVGRQETAALERFVEALGTIAGISTLLGLLGTVSGMIKIFSVISTQAAVNPASLAGGISEALITTYAGLTVAIPTIVMHRYLQSKADALVLEMEDHSIRLVDLLKEKEDGF